MDDAIEGSDPTPGVVRVWQGKHIALMKMDFGVESLGFGDHARREVDSQGIHALTMQITRDLTRATAHVADGTQTSHLTRKTIQAIAVEWFAIHFIFEFFGVFRRNLIIAGLSIFNLFFHYRFLSPRNSTSD